MALLGKVIVSSINEEAITHLCLLVQSSGGDGRALKAKLTEGEISSMVGDMTYLPYSDKPHVYECTLIFGGPALQFDSNNFNVCKVHAPGIREPQSFELVAGLKHAKTLIRTKQ